MEMEGGISGCQVRGIPKQARSIYHSQSVIEKKKTNQTQGNEYVQ